MWLQFWLRGLHIDKVTYAIRVVVIATVLDVHSLFLGLFLTWLLWLTLGLMGCKNNKVDEFNTSAFCEYTLRLHTNLSCRPPLSFAGLPQSPLEFFPASPALRHCAGALMWSWVQTTSGSLRSCIVHPWSWWKNVGVPLNHQIFLNQSWKCKQHLWNMMYMS